jgi:hypothetical protein
LDNILKDWPHEPGEIQVRKIIGNDGREKIQLRIDLGVIQMESIGRPDGQRPHGFDSLLSWHRELASEREQKGEKYNLNAEQCADMQHEGIQYYHRYVSLFQLADYHGVIRDTQRNLEMITFLAEHAETDEAAGNMDQFKPYILMMNTRARASLELERDDFEAALRQIDRGRGKIVELYPDEEAATKSPEIAFLDEWRDEVKDRKPLSRIEQLEREMARAIASEAYERAAELRDKIRNHQQKEG